MYDWWIFYLKVSFANQFVQIFHASVCSFKLIFCQYQCIFPCRKQWTFYWYHESKTDSEENAVGINVNFQCVTRQWRPLVLWQGSCWGASWANQQAGSYRKLWILFICHCRYDYKVIYKQPWGIKSARDQCLQCIHDLRQSGGIGNWQ